MNQQPMRVGYVLKRFPRFSETFIVNELLELQRQGVAVEVFSLMKPPEEPRHESLLELRCPVTYLEVDNLVRSRIGIGHLQDGMKQISIADVVGEASLSADLCPGKDISTLGKLYSQAAALSLLALHKQITHLHAHFASNATTVAALASRLSGIPYSFTAHARDIYHEYVNRELDDEVRVRKINGSLFTVTVSDYNARHLKSLRGVNGSHIRRLYNGIDLRCFIPSRQSDATNHFCAVGRLVEKKGFSDLITACDRLTHQGWDFRCSIIGNGPLHDPLQDRIEELGIGHCVRLVGSMTQERLRRYLCNAAAVVLPCVVTASGDRDGLPTVLLEAMAMGLPTISTRVAGVPEIIDHGNSGLLAEPNNPQALAECMTHLLADSKQAAAMGHRARRRAESLFDLSKNVGTLKQWFESSSAQKLPASQV